MIRPTNTEHFQAVYALIPPLTRAIRAKKVIALIGGMGTGKTSLARAATPNACYIDLSKCAGGDWIHPLRNETRTVILDEVSNLQPGTLNADVVMEQCEGFNGLVCLFQTETDARSYLGNSGPVEAFCLDLGQVSALPAWK